MIENIEVSIKFVVKGGNYTTTETAYKRFSIIVNESDNFKFSDFERVLKFRFNCDYFAIVHNLDYDDNGILKTIHKHYLITFDKKVRKQTILNAFGDNKILISIDNIYNYKSYARYLLHLDNSEKHQYNISDIECFNNTLEVYNNVIQDDDEISFERIDALIQQYGFNIWDIMRHLTLKKARPYYNIINDYLRYRYREYKNEYDLIARDTDDDIIPF